MPKPLPVSSSPLKAQPEPKPPPRPMFWCHVPLQPEWSADGMFYESFAAFPGRRSKISVLNGSARTLWSVRAFLCGVCMLSRPPTLRDHLNCHDQDQSVLRSKQNQDFEGFIFITSSITMLCLKLTLLSLLTAAPGFLVSGENIITCSGDHMYLECDTGVISVQSSVYGRTNSETCSANRPHCDVVNTDCSVTISTVAGRCNGLKICQLKTDLLGTPDTCEGTYKYYNTTYDCVKARRTVVCEYGYSTLDCGYDNIYIMNANYGRDNSQTCSSELPNDLIKNTNCCAPGVHSAVATLCNGHQKCTVEASNSVFSDPCADTYKYLSVSYFCTREIVVCEGDTASLLCGDHKIKVFGADYGRTDSTICAFGQTKIQISNTECSMLDAADKVKAGCEGRHSCEITACNDVFSDPCPNTFKYLKVVYACV
ncbi:rhamnose-binding lectin-like [Neoarius graeffei]|uniref:rhamnose-binding lectin-like n=1 Tax=Neoarius graeffei TaxID=443677 RepID=UPI00298CF84B|nr:rhamnose-binding lectin-like [Neoarius graeffei]